jgi:catechol 2,3-dioxygenase-like lactoylglutathione lyase family enzyme
MITRIGHMAFRVPDLDAGVDFLRHTLGLVETERTAGVSYLTCNERHHELMLIEDPVRRGYDHIALEVEDAAALERAMRTVEQAGAKHLGGIYDGEPGIDRALRLVAPGGHVFKLFCGMSSGPALEPGDRPEKFEHVSVKVRHTPRFERFLQDGLGLRFSDRMGPLASWWHCDEDHHGMAVTFGPRSELHHYAWTMPDLNAMGRAADRLKRHHDQRLVWGPSRHGPGNNMFMYFHDNDGAMIELCADMARMSDYVPRRWPIGPKTLNLWGGPPPPRFILTGVAPAAPGEGRPSYAMERSSAVSA